MSLKLKKLAVATAAAISMGVAGQAQSGDLLFPYVVVSPSVTTLISVVNTNSVTTNSPTLWYTLLSKQGNPPDNAAGCLKRDFPMTTSQFDIQTFDVSGVFENEKGVMFRDPSTNNRWREHAPNYSFLSNPLAPTRAYLVVDDVQAAANTVLRSGNPLVRDAVNGVQSDNALYGEAFVVEFASGAVWGYQAGRAPSSQGRPIPGSAGVAGGTGPGGLHLETGPRQGDFRVASSGVSVGPLAVAGATDDWRWVAPVPLLPQRYAQTLFFVTPLVENMRSAAGNTAATVGGVAQPGTAFVRLTWGPMGGNATTFYDRDELPESGALARDVTCVGAVNAFDMLNPDTLRRITEDEGRDIGWGWLSVSGHRRQADGTIANANTQVSASVIKLEYNEGTNFAGRTMGTFNNAFQLRGAQLTSRTSSLGNRQWQLADGTVIPVPRSGETVYAPGQAGGVLTLTADPVVDPDTRTLTLSGTDGDDDAQVGVPITAVAS